MTSNKQQSAYSPPAPPDPNDKSFWRIKADWSVDTDGDGSPDWAEFEMEQDPSHPFHTLADAFNADVDANGVPDGSQLDLDGDQTSDAVDIAAGNPVLAFIKEPEPRYAIFPIAGAEPPPGDATPIQINDQGCVLYINGTWSGEGWAPLASVGNNLTECRAYGMNDLGDVIGVGYYKLQDNPERREYTLVHWPDPSGAPSVVMSGDHYATPTEDMAVRQTAPGPIISNDKQVIGRSFTVSHPPTGLETTPDESHHIWTLAGPSTSRGAEVPGMIWITDALTYWGRTSDGKGKIVTAERELELPWVPRTVVEVGQDSFAVFSPEKSDIFAGGYSNEAQGYGAALDTSEEGVAIARHASGMVAPILLNGQWKQILRTAAFDVPQEWRSSNVRLLDTSRFGWILASKGEESAADYAALLPVRLEGRFTDRNGQLVTEAAGVATTSAGADVMDAAAGDRLWIMAPQGTSKSVLWTLPIDGPNSLEISGTGLKIDGQSSTEISGFSTLVEFEANPGAGGAEVLLDLKLGGVTDSVSKPIGVKVMKQRTIRLAVYKVTKAASGSFPAVESIFVPEEEQLEKYLNDIFRPQLNVTFEVKIEPTPLVVNWDIGTVNKALDGNGVDGVLTDEQLSIAAQKGLLLAAQALTPGNVPFNEHMTLYLIGCEKPIDTDAFGLASQETRTGWVIGNFVSPMNSNTLLTYDQNLGHMHNIAHEIGHILVGPGHPDQKAFPGRAELLGTNLRGRLMISSSGSGSSSVFSHGKLLVKGEWDAANTWMQSNIDP